ncbi:MAG: thermonuclease family protein [Actinobacteria bacterium]|nr:thermonuclease family protein [Actinomycetota bacterium]
MRRLLIPIALAAAVLATAAAGAPERSFILRGTLAEVVDGDTVSVRLDGGGLERVRLIGIDTPERGECYAGRATGAARALAGGRRVELAGDETQDTRDRYGRLLAYVWVAGGGKDLGYQLVARGLARVYVYESAFARIGPYRYAERIGRRRPESVYQGCAAPAAVAAVPGTRCDPSYPGVCIPPAPPDLDCGQVEHRRFRVVGPDPHAFDGDGDGVGCEG